MNTVNRQTNKNTASLQTDDKTKHTDEKEANLQVKNVGCWYLTYIHASQMGTPCRQLLIYIGVYSLLFQWLVHDSFNINPLMFHNLFVLLHRVRLKPPPCCSMAFRDATTTFLSLVTCQQPKREKPPWLIATTLSPLLSKQYFASTSSNNCFQSVQDACVVRELRDISASPPFTFHLVWSKHCHRYHCFAGHHKPRRREVLF